MTQPMLAFTICWGLVAPVLAAEFTTTREEDGVTIMIDGDLFARYVTRSGNKPIVWPIIGPTGKEMTRAYPMRDAGKAEVKDHPHHRSLWFTHGDVNRADFWAENSRHGTVEHVEFQRVEGGDTAVIVTRNNWRNQNGDVLCTDERTLTFGGDQDVRWIDLDLKLMPGKEAVTFGDTKEGTFGIRVPGTMKVNAEPGGQIINSLGDTDQEAWGKKASWVDYHGPVGDETLGITIMNHPTSFGFPTYWHVRPYGLFAANPFGKKPFENDPHADGSFTLQPHGSPLVLRYRVLLHRGDHDRAKVSEAFVDYAKIDKITNDEIPNDERRPNDE